MEDMYIKPGNQERGWNDPPQFSYGLQTAQRTPRTLLNQRAAPPVSGAGTTPPISNPLAPPPCGAVPPPVNSAATPPPRPPPGCTATPPPPPSGPSGDLPLKSQRKVTSSQSENEADVEMVVLVLNRALDACRQTATTQLCNDVAKRLRLLEDSWRTGRLSLPVRRRMDTLAKELQSGHWDAADEIHRSLMVDHVTEVSQWMVGVKRLIAETRKLSPELLDNLLKTAGPDQDSAEPDQDPAKPVQDPTESVQNQTGPAQDPVSQS